MVLPAEQYLRVYPNGYFSELAQLELDAGLAALGEKPIQIAPAQGNPFTQGTVRADVDFRVGDSYSYRQLDRDTKEERRRFTNTVVRITDTEVIFDRKLVLDRLGNLVGHPDGRRFTPRQDQPLEYAIGKKWKTRFSVVNRHGARFNTEIEFRITRRENVTVPAGAFGCFVIEGAGYSANEHGVWFAIASTRWMAPDRVRSPVISENYLKVSARIGGPHFGKGGKGWEVGDVLDNERAELVEYKQTR